MAFLHFHADQRSALVPRKIIEREIVDPRVGALDSLDDALREIIGLPPTTQQPAQKLKLVG